MTEVTHDRLGTPGILISSVDFTATRGEQVAPDFRDQLRGLLLHEDTADPDDTDQA